MNGSLDEEQQTTVGEDIEDVVNNNDDYAVIPQKNTIGGAVKDYLDALIGENQVYVVGEAIIPINQTLMGIKGETLDDIKTVCSHPQGLTVLAENVQISDSNITRFYVLSKDKNIKGGSRAVFIANYEASKIDEMIEKITKFGSIRFCGSFVLSEKGT